jgi:divalent metal cation (Fe/Co/Zn/Cd) transporter
VPEAHVETLKHGHDGLTVAPARGERPPRNEVWLRDARRARLLSWLSLIWMTGEGVVGIGAGIAAGSVALIGFGLSSAVEGLASAIVIWRFTGPRTHSEHSERTAQKAVAISFWLLAPYISVEAVYKLAVAAHPRTSAVGIALTIASIVVMPALGRAKHRLGERLGSAATAGEGTQNILCALLAAAVLIGLLGQTLVGAWWLDPLAALFIAAVAVKEGREAWHGVACADCTPIGFSEPDTSDEDCCA